MMARHSQPDWLISSFLILTLRIDESEADRSERLQKWQKYLEDADAKKEVAEINQQLDAPADETVETAASETTSTSEDPKIESG